MDSVSTTRITHIASIGKIDRLILYTEIMATYSDNLRGDINAGCGVNSEFLTLDLKIRLVPSKSYGVNFPWLYCSQVLNVEIDVLTDCNHCLDLP
jgi:hypothetical protein